MKDNPKIRLMALVLIDGSIFTCIGYTKDNKVILAFEPKKEIDMTKVAGVFSH